MNGKWELVISFEMVMNDISCSLCHCHSYLINKLSLFKLIYTIKYH